MNPNQATSSSPKYFTGNSLGSALSHKGVAYDILFARVL